MRIMVQNHDKGLLKKWLEDGEHPSTICAIDDKITTGARLVTIFPMAAITPAWGKLPLYVILGLN